MENSSKTLQALDVSQSDLDPHVRKNAPQQGREMGFNLK